MNSVHRPRAASPGSIADASTRSLGGVANVLRIHGLRPETLDGHLRLYRAVMPSKIVVGLSGKVREMMAVMVSAYNECHY